MNTSTEPNESRESAPQWNTDAHIPTDSGGDARDVVIYETVNWFVKKWRSFRGRRAA